MRERCLTRIGHERQVPHKTQPPGLEERLHPVVAEFLRERSELLEVVGLHDDFVEQDELADEIAEVDDRGIVRLGPGLTSDPAQESVAWFKLRHQDQGCSSDRTY